MQPFRHRETQCCTENDAVGRHPRTAGPPLFVGDGHKQRSHVVTAALLVLWAVLMEPQNAPQIVGGVVLRAAAAYALTPQQYTRLSVSAQV